VGQGALGIEICTGRDDLLALLAPLNHPETEACVLAERATSRALAGSCTVPLGAHATINDNLLKITGFVASVDGKKIVRAQAQGSPQQAEIIGQQLAAALVAQGADKILAALEH